MKSTYKYFLPIIIFFTIVICSCNKTYDKQKALLNISLAGLGSNGINNENEINTIRICICNRNIVEKTKLFSGTEIMDNTIQITTTEGEKIIYAIINETNDLTIKFNSAITQEQIKNIITNNSTKSISRPFVMSGSTQVTINSQIQDQTVNINVKRIVARIKLNIKKSEESLSDILIKGIKLRRIPTKTYTIKSKNNQVTEFYSFEKQLEIPYNLTTENYEFNWSENEKYFYLYENINTNNDTTGKATFIFIDAIYNNVPTRYKAYINNINATNSRFSIKRNYEYRLEATIQNIGEYDGLVFNTQVIPWENTVLNKTFGEASFDGEWKSGQAIDNATKKVEYKFKLNLPEGASWKATITNGLDFKIDGIQEGITGKEYTIKIIALKNLNNSARKTEFYITVNGNEIDLNRDGSIGKGKRYIITQSKY